MIKSLAFKNSAFSVFQNLALSLSTLVLFKVMISMIGLDQTSIWIYLSSITAITGFGSFGFSNALTFFIPKYKVTSAEKDVNKLISTCLFATLMLTILLSVASYFIFHALIPKVFNTGLVGTAQEVLPFVLLSFLLSGLNSIFLSILDGLQLMHIRSKVSMLATLLFVVFALATISFWGVKAVVFAQVLQNLFLLLLGAYYVRKHIPAYRPSLSFSKEEFKRTFKYGFNFQLISITQIISEPYMKTMIIRFAGTEMLATFDLCLKILGAIRGLLVSANQTITPGITAYSFSERKKRINIFFKTNYIVISIFSLLLFFVPVCFSNLISIVFFKKLSWDFVNIMLLLAIALFFNVLALPAFFSFLGMGRLKWNVIGNVVAAALMFVFAPVLGYFFPSNMIILSWALPTMVGPVFLLWKYKQENNIAIKFFFNRNLLIILTWIGIAIATVYGLNYLYVSKYLSQAMLFAYTGAIILAVIAGLIAVNKTIRIILKRVKYGR